MIHCEPSPYRTFIYYLSKNSNYPLICSVIGAFVGSVVYSEDPIFGFVLYGWTFILLYALALGIAVLVEYIIDVERAKKKEPCDEI